MGPAKKMSSVEVLLTVLFLLLSVHLYAKPGESGVQHIRFAESVEGSDQSTPATIQRLSRLGSDFIEHFNEISKFTPGAESSDLSFRLSMQMRNSLNEALKVERKGLITIPTVLQWELPAYCTSLEEFDRASMRLKVRKELPPELIAPIERFADNIVARFSEQLKLLSELGQTHFIEGVSRAAIEGITSVYVEEAPLEWLLVQSVYCTVDHSYLERAESHHIFGMELFPWHLDSLLRKSQVLDEKQRLWNPHHGFLSKLAIRRHKYQVSRRTSEEISRIGYVAVN